MIDFVKRVVSGDFSLQDLSFGGSSSSKALALHPEFTGGVRLNDIAVTRAGDKYALLTKEGWIVTTVPTDGKFEINGAQIEITRKNGELSISSRRERKVELFKHFGASLVIKRERAADK